MERPNLKWITSTGPDGRKSEICFRNFSSPSDLGKVQEDAKQQQFYSEMVEDDDDLNDTLFNVVEDPPGSNKFVCNLQLPWYENNLIGFIFSKLMFIFTLIFSALFGCIIGPRGSIKIGIEGASRTKINVPQRSDDTMGKIGIL